MNQLSRRRMLTLLGATACAPLVACGNKQAASPAASASTAASSGSWPQEVTHPLGKTTLPSQPQRIVSTSTVLTGTLLALDAPVIASGGSKPNAEGLDENGFFTHWSAKAKEKGVTSVYQNSELDLEAVMAQKPDLIIVSATGGDSQAKAYAQLAKIAPTIAVDYNEVGWEEATTTVGRITGLSDRATQVLKGYDAKLAELKQAMQPPNESVQAIVFTPGQGSAFAKVGGPHEKVLSKLGVSLDKTDLSSGDGGIGGEKRDDFTFLSEEATITALKARNLLLVGGDESYVDKLKSNKAYANIPALKGGKVVPLGLASFKLDYFSALDMAQHVADAYKK